MARPASSEPDDLLFWDCALSTPTDVAGVLRESRKCGRAADIEPQGVFRAAVARFMTLTTYVNESLNRVVTC